MKLSEKIMSGIITVLVAVILSTMNKVEASIVRINDVEKKGEIQGQKQSDGLIRIEQKQDISNENISEKLDLVLEELKELKKYRR